MKLRDYQRRCVEANLETFKDTATVLNVMPTGTGKTITFADTIARHCIGSRAMVVAHREELIIQACDKIKRVTGMEAEVEMAEFHADLGLMHRAPVVVSTVQTQNAGKTPRMEKFDPYEFNLLVVDEAHHATSPSYQRVIEHYRSNPDLRVLGVTATPDRHDEEALGKIFDVCAFDYGLLDAISDGWLVDIEQQFIEVEGLDFSACKADSNDLNQIDIDKVISDEKIMHRCIAPLLEIAGDRKVLLFATGVATAERMVEIINRYRNKTVAFIIHAATPRDERRDKLREYRKGKFRIMVNVGIATEGFDEPGIQIVAMARPTKSRCLYAQMIGRGTRPDESCVTYINDCELPASRRTIIACSSKPSLLVIDFAGNSGKHKLVSTADVLGGRYSDEVVDRAAAAVKDRAVPVNMSLALRMAEEDEEKARKLHRKPVVAKAIWSANAVSPFDVLSIKPVRERGWEAGRKPTQRMLDLLQRAKIEHFDKLSMAEAGRIIGELKRRWDRNLCTFPQAKLLKKYGEGSEITVVEASALIERIKNNNWKPLLRSVHA